MKQIGIIQILRAVAALMIVMSHAQSDTLDQAVKTGFAFTRMRFLPWDSGVDLFFVISGFIMVHSSQHLFARPYGGLTFMAQRVIRIVPLYWIMTGIMLVVAAYVTWRGGGQAFPSLSEIATSLGFVPYSRPGDGEPRPFVPLGWTLNYEMFFYFVFSIFVGFPRRIAVPGIVFCLSAGVACGVFFQPRATALAYWSDPIILEFACGMLIATLFHKQLRLRPAAAACLIVGAVIFIVFDLDGMSTGASDVDENGFRRLFGAGLPMAVLFAALVLADSKPPMRGWAARFLVRLGDASYALYLFHPLAVVLLRKLYLAGGFESAIGFWPLVGAEIALAVVLAFLIHRLIETPISRWLRAWLPKRSGEGVAPVAMVKVSAQ